MTLARFGTITVENAIGLELQVVAAVVVGGVNIFGGSGTVIGAMLGAVMIGTLEQSLFRLQISQFWLDALLGLLILLAVASDTLILRRLRALWARTELRLVAEASPGSRPAAHRQERCAGAGRGRVNAQGRVRRASAVISAFMARPCRLLDVIEVDRHFLGGAVGAPGGDGSAGGYPWCSAGSVRGSASPDAGRRVPCCTDRRRSARAPHYRRG